MKTITSITLCGILLTGYATAQHHSSNGASDPQVPVGTLDVNKHTVREGVKPELTWNIEYPSEVTTVVDIEDDDEIVAKCRLRVQVYVIGVGITDRRGREYPARSYIHYSSHGWVHIYTGIGSNVNPTRVYDERIVERGERIRFRARYHWRNSPYYYNPSDNIRVLVNGDTPPNNAAGYSHQTSAAEYMQPYISNGRLALGPLDVIYAAELTHSDPNHWGFDLQDTIVLVRFSRVTR